MREVCQASGGEVSSEFFLNPPSSPAVLMHWRALIELLGLMPAPDGTCYAVSGSLCPVVR